MAGKRLTAKEKKKRARRRFWAGIFACSLVAALCILITVSEQMTQPFLPTWEEIFVKVGLADPPPAEGELRVRVLDVGNADCILARCGGQSLLIDAGEKESGPDIVSALRREGVKKLDYVIATHPDADHIGGMAEVISSLDIGTFIMAPMPEEATPTTRTYTAMLEALAAKGLRFTTAKPGAQYALGEARLDILGPTEEYRETNNQSVVCKLTFGSKRLLFMGDAEKEAEDALLAAHTDVRADVIKLGHHGSASSSQREFLEAVGAKTALITCGAGNAYGHPEEETLATLRALDITAYRSDVCGDITVTTDGQTLTVTTEEG